ncbi:hypothetical protein [Pseudoduganella aquatica]|uniref:hypothetical protein n=1 Tax=Pseudoduganella aquatica TaxID=2660641 RepID=UPI001E32DE8C|nr:hypothetical protein [Pseudoduganella aquatica]
MRKSAHKLIEPAIAAGHRQNHHTDAELPPIERRKAALSKVFGILKGRTDAPQDGLAFQLEMRSE